MKTNYNDYDSDSENGSLDDVLGSLMCKDQEELSGDEQAEKEDAGVFS